MKINILASFVLLIVVTFIATQTALASSLFGNKCSQTLNEDCICEAGLPL